jgi:hypothetical protein
MTPRIKRISVSLAALVGLLTLSACAAPVATSASNGQEQPHTITVTGYGAAYGAPDVAVAQIGVQSRSADPGAAVDDTTAKMNAIIAALKALGVEEKDIQTSNFSVYAQQDFDSVTGRSETTFTYVADNTVTVTVRDLSKVGEVLGSAVAAGANNIYGVNFSVSDPAALEAEARDEAMADAKSRAEQLARAAGVTLGAPMTISEYSGGPVPFAVAEARTAIGGGAPVPVATGQIQVSLQVNVTYLIR